MWLAVRRFFSRDTCAIDNRVDLRTQVGHAFKADHIDGRVKTHRHMIARTIGHFAQTDDCPYDAKDGKSENILAIRYG